MEGTVAVSGVVIIVVEEVIIVQVLATSASVSRFVWDLVFMVVKLHGPHERSSSLQTAHRRPQTWSFRISEKVVCFLGALEKMGMRFLLSIKVKVTVGFRVKHWHCHGLTQ